MLLVSDFIPPPLPPVSTVALCVGRRLPESLPRLVTLLNVEIFLLPQCPVEQQETTLEHN